jgi:hypothetical protein
MHSKRASALRAVECSFPTSGANLWESRRLATACAQAISQRLFMPTVTKAPRTTTVPHLESQGINNAAFYVCEDPIAFFANLAV